MLCFISLFTYGKVPCEIRVKMILYRYYVHEAGYML
jgi:hypothetical protein